MAHGIEAYFLERARFERRLSLFIGVVSVAFLAGLWLLSTPVARRHPIDARRFGFEGREQFVRRILLENSSPITDLLDPTNPNPVEARKGGSQPVHLSPSPQAPPETRPRRFGSGESEAAKFGTLPCTAMRPASTSIPGLFWWT